MIKSIRGFSLPTNSLMAYFALLFLLHYGVVIPVLFGALWIHSPSLVFYIGAVMAGISLILVFNVPNQPEAGNESIIGRAGNFTAETGAKA